MVGRWLKSVLTARRMAGVVQVAGCGMATWAGFGFNEITGRAVAAVALITIGIVAEKDTEG